MARFRVFRKNGMASITLLPGKSRLHFGASIRIWEECIQQLQAQARDVNMNSDFPDYISRLLKRAISAGIGEEDLAALV
jgi:hypothetical protein